MKHDKIQDELCSYFKDKDDLDKYDFIVSYALKNECSFDSTLRQNSNLIKGCESKLWMTISLINGLTEIHVDSDSLLIKGLSQLIAKVYNNKSPYEIINTELYFIECSGLMSLIRGHTNGIKGEISQIYNFAKIHLTQEVENEIRNE